MVDILPCKGYADDLMRVLFPLRHLFSTEERAQLEQLLSEISARVADRRGGSSDFLESATVEELDTLYRYSNLMEAMEHDDQAEAEKHRKLLSKGKQ